MRDVYFDILNNYQLINDEPIVVAVSGGPDSMALLALLIEIKKKLSIKIICAHVNHNMRIESKQEKKMVEDYCLKNGVVFEYMEILNYNKGNFHDDARKKRYDFFEKLIEKYQAKKLFTAHHADDLAETILIRLNRGSTLKGYAGFAKVSKLDKYRIIRPLISVSKDDILSFVKKNEIPYAIDCSNLKDIYTRNRIRKYIIPKLKEENSNILNKFYQFSQTLLDYYNYVDKIVLSKYELICDDNSLDIFKLKKEEKLIQINILHKWLHSYYKDEINKISNCHVDALYRLINSSKVNKMIELPNQVFAYKFYDKMILKVKSQNCDSYHIILSDIVNLPNGHTIEKISTIEKNSNYVCLLDSSELTLPIYIRTRFNGDRMSVKGMVGKRKVNDIFIDKKINLDDRDSWPIVVDSNDQIIWLPGLKKSKFDKQIYEKYDIILKYN